MKPGLLDILACPICKYYPLKLHVFKWETNIGLLKQASDLLSSKNNDELVKFLEKNNEKSFINTNNDKVSDSIVREPKSVSEYLKELNSKEDTLSSIIDLTETSSKSILNYIQNDLIKELKSKSKITDLLFGLNLLNWYFYKIEIENGLINCEKCKRWYPIDDTIPQMLPDELRNEKTEVKFLTDWKKLVPESILNQGIPFNLK